MDFPETQMFLYEKKGDGAVILRCFSRDSQMEIPETIDGLPVRELAPYLFSSYLDEKVLTAAMQEGRAWICASQSSKMQDFPDLPVLCGERLKELILPPTLRHVGRYCFYNCGHLRRLEFPGSLYDWGSGVFTGCHRIRELCVHVEPDGSSGLKQMLDELPESLHVEFCADRRSYASLIFPEFYEEGVENTPARILETHVHGSGILYRNCFQGKRFDFAQYDALFSHALSQESIEIQIRLALGRLQYPYRLDQQAKQRYEDCIRNNGFQTGCCFLNEKDPEGLQWFLERFAQPQQNAALLEQLMDYASRAGEVQAISRLMNFRRQSMQTGTGRRRLEL